MRDPARPRRASRRRLALVALCAVVALVAVSTAYGQVRDRHEVTWEEVAGTGLQPGDRLAVTLSSYDKVESESFLALLDGSGQGRLVQAPGLGEGSLAASDGVLCAVGHDGAFRLTRGAATRSADGDHVSAGSWNQVRSDGSCLTVTGSAEVLGGAAAGPVSLPGNPLQLGASSSEVWSRDPVLIDVPATDRLRRTDLTTGRTTTPVTWRTTSDPRARGGRGVDFAPEAASDLVWHRERVYYLENLVAQTPEGVESDWDPALGAELRLVELDPATGGHTSTLLADSEADQVESELASGHVVDGELYAIDRSGRIVAVELDDRTRRVVGRLSDAAWGAQESGALATAWSGRRLVAVHTDEHGRARADTHDLSTGRLVDSQRLPVLDGHLDDTWSVWDVALLD